MCHVPERLRTSALHARFNGKRNKVLARLHSIDNINKDITSIAVTQRATMDLINDQGQLRPLFYPCPLLPNGCISGTDDNDDRWCTYLLVNILAVLSRIGNWLSLLVPTNHGRKLIVGSVFKCKYNRDIKVHWWTNSFVLCLNQLRLHGQTIKFTVFCKVLVRFTTHFQIFIHKSTLIYICYTLKIGQHK